MATTSRTLHDEDITDIVNIRHELEDAALADLETIHCANPAAVPVIRLQKLRAEIDFLSRKLQSPELADVAKRFSAVLVELGRTVAREDEAG